MRQIYVITLFFLPVWGFSQLHVVPNGNKDSYIFVENQILYVQKEINLKINPGNSTQASLYLRNESQLLQGDENIKNSGDGLLSVFQEGKATAYTYNYWSSPVGNNSGNNSFGNILFEPLSKTHSRKAQIISDYNGKTNPLQISGRWIYKLAGEEYADWVYLANDFDVAPGEGFTMKGVEGVNTEVILYNVANNPGNEQRYDFRGLPNTGSFSLNIKSKQIKLVGNPYPSALDLDLFLIENTNTTGIAYFWDSQPVPSHYLEDYEGGYGAYSPGLGNNGYVPPVFSKYDNQGSPILETGSTGSNYPRRFSPVAQGFLIEGLKDGNFLFKNTYRIFKKENPENSQFKSSLSEMNTEEEIPSVRIQIEFDDLYVRELLLAFHPKATIGADRAMDAKNLSPLESDVGWEIGNDFYLIAVKPSDSKEEVPFLLTTNAEMNVNFKLTHVQNYEDDIHLWDAEKDIYYDLKNQEINFLLPKGVFTKRFWIKFNADENDETIPEEPEFENSQVYRIFQNNSLNQTEIISPANSSTEGIFLYDSSGRKIREMKGQEGQYSYELSTQNLSKGIYIIKILSAEGTVVSKKVIISNN